MATDVAVVVANYAGEEVLDDCLRSVGEQSHVPAELLVVDAGPGSGGRRIAESRGATVLVRPNRGLGYLYNEGARSARSELVLLLNNDVALEPRCLELLVDELVTSSQCFATDPRQVSWDGSALVHGRATLTRGPLLRQPLPGFRLELQGPADAPIPTVGANGGAMLARRERLLELGGFDETMFLDFEDIDLCWRAWSRGWSSSSTATLTRLRCPPDNTPTRLPRCSSKPTASSAYATRRPRASSPRSGRRMSAANARFSSTVRSVKTRSSCVTIPSFAR